MCAYLLLLQAINGCFSMLLPLYTYTANAMIVSNTIISQIFHYHSTAILLTNYDQPSVSVIREYHYNLVNVIL